MSEKDHAREDLPPSVESMLLGIAAELGFYETDEMFGLRKAANSDSSVVEKERLISQYNILATETTLPTDALGGARVQIGVILATAAVIQQCGLGEVAKEYVEEASFIAGNMSDKKTREIIDTLLQADKIEFK